MGEAVLAMISGLGGAGLGGWAALWVQRAKRRDDAAAAAIAAERSEAAAVAAAQRAEQAAVLAAERAERQAVLAAEHAERQAVLAAERAERQTAVAVQAAEDKAALEVLATARVALRAWSTNAQRVLAITRSRGELDVGEYRRQVLSEMRELTEALYRIPTRAYPTGRGNSTANGRAFVEQVEEVAFEVSALLEGTPPSAEEISMQLNRVRNTYSRVSNFFLKAVEEVTEVPVIPVLSRGIPPLPQRRRSSPG